MIISKIREPNFMKNYLNPARIESVRVDDFLVLY